MLRPDSINNFETQPVYVCWSACRSRRRSRRVHSIMHVCRVPITQPTQQLRIKLTFSDLEIKITLVSSMNPDPEGRYVGDGHELVVFVPKDLMAKFEEVFILGATLGRSWAFSTNSLHFVGVHFRRSKCAPIKRH